MAALTARLAWDGGSPFAARRLPLALIALALAWIAMEAVVVATTSDTRLAQARGFDRDTYVWAAQDWLAGRGFYHAYQLAGPYQVQAREILYPPPVLLLLAPFTVLPHALWWAVPIAVTAAAVAHWRPSRWGWAALLWCSALPASADAVLDGNPVIWAVAAVALATRWPAFAPWVLLKPVFAPFALLHARSRWWWAGMGVWALACLAFLPMWPDYLRVLANARWPADGGPLYPLVQAPLVAVPVIAWAARRRQ